MDTLTSIVEARKNLVLLDLNKKLQHTKDQIKKKNSRNRHYIQDKYMTTLKGGANRYSSKSSYN